MNTSMHSRRFAARSVIAAIAAVLSAGALLATGAAATAAPSPARSAAPQQRDVHAPEWANATAASTAARLDTDAPALKGQGADVWGWAQDQASPGKLDVWLVHYTAGAARALQARYGAGVVIETQSRAPAQAAGRLNDTPPYFGGDRIELPGASCTSGPTVYGNRANTPYMFTAGHCAAVGATVTTPQGRVMGHVTNRRLCNNCIDGETVSGDYGRWMWTGGVNTSSAIYEDYGRPPAKGARLTTDGSYTGEVRNNLVTNANMTIKVCEGSNCWYERYVFQVENTSGHRVCQPGDSGSPIYTHEGSTDRAIVNGILVAEGSATVCYGIRIDALENYFNVHIA